MKLCDSCFFKVRYEDAPGSNVVIVDRELTFEEAADALHGIKRSGPEQRPSTNGLTEVIPPHTAMKNALVAAMGYKQEDVTCWGEYNKASEKLRSACITPEQVPDLHAFSCGLAVQGKYSHLCNWQRTCQNTKSSSAKHKRPVTSRYPNRQTLAPE